MKRSLVAAIAAVAGTAVMSTTALAVTVAMGNPAIDRTSVDTFRNFTIVDTNNPAAFDGSFTRINYYAERAGTIRFVVVDAGDVVAWVSEPIMVSGAGAAVQDFGHPVAVTAGSNLGVYSVGGGVISFQPSGAPAAWTPNNSGLPTIGQTIAEVTSSNRFRTYSMNASVEATSPKICKKGGWKTYGFKNQGRCIASVVANDHSRH